MRDLVGFAWAHARGDRRRTLAALFAIVVAVTSLVVLTGTVRTERLQVTGTVESNFRSTYDILVRPKGTSTALESSLGAVRPNFLTGTYGGITPGQLNQIRTLSDVQVAAPVAVVGMVTRNVKLTIDAGHLLGTRQHAMVRYALTGSARHGTGTTSTGSGYLYLTRNPLTAVDDPSSHASSPKQIETRPAGPVTACLASDAEGRPATPAQVFTESCWSSAEGSPATVEALLSIPMAVEAIDPVAEDSLTGLQSAIVDGRALTGSDATGTASAAGGPIDTVTAVMASRLPFDFTATLKVQELNDATVTKVLDSNDAHTRRSLVQAATPVASVGSITKDAATAYSSDIVANTSPTASADESMFVLSVIRPGQVDYTPGLPLLPHVVPCDPSVWLSSPHGTDYLPTPSSVCDTSFRSVSVAAARTDLGSPLSFDVVGKYDPKKIERPSTLNDVPLETYRSPVVTGGDDASKAVLGNQPLLSDLNPGGYVQSPPAILIPLNALPLLAKHVPSMNPTAPISSVRVRVAGVTGITPTDRERIRMVAEQIQKRTGLTVDITAGASLVNQTVALPKTTSGTPALLVNEQWTKKGVAVAVADAIDTKSILLLALVLASSALTVWLTATAAVQARRRELGVLACVGWPPSLRRRALLVEQAGIGVTAGVVGCGLAVPIAASLGVGLLWQALIAAVPAGVILACLPGLGASLTAGRVAPADLFRPPSRQVGRTITVNGPAGVGLAMLGQRPGRLLIGILGVALAVASGGLLASIVAHVHNILIGSFLGDAVTVQVRTPDAVAAILIGLLGLTALATLLFLGVAEDARSLAALKAVGWTDAMLGRTVAVQALLIATIGALLGATITVTLWTTLFGHPDPTTALITAAICLAAVASSLTVALGPTAWLARLPTARILSAD